MERKEANMNNTTAGRKEDGNEEGSVHTKIDVWHAATIGQLIQDEVKDRIKPEK